MICGRNPAGAEQLHHSARYVMLTVSAICICQSKDLPMTPQARAAQDVTADGSGLPQLHTGCGACQGSGIVTAPRLARL
jgi:hypothetical protein